ncbi:hypothetical protein [Streptomyces sp. CBMA152]|uniref:hypothetical protein n=1 Tax=Streptomyces sp. CBMA152 TaxID=1896312 RepID=UPI001660BC1A|nr:hypothetical protein [Streptomyces sp. CBMA152]
MDDADWDDEEHRAGDRSPFHYRQIVGQAVSLAAALSSFTERARHAPRRLRTTTRP